MARGQQQVHPKKGLSRTLCSLGAVQDGCAECVGCLGSVGGRGGSGAGTTTGSVTDGAAGEPRCGRGPASTQASSGGLSKALDTVYAFTAFDMGAGAR